MDLVQIVGDILKPLGYPVHWQLRPKMDEQFGLSYHFFNEKGELYGDGIEKAVSIYCQVDIWSKGEYFYISKQVKAAMLNKGFLRVNEDDNYESDVKLYHKVIVFSFVYEIETEG